MARAHQKTSVQKTRRRVTRNLPAKTVKSGQSVKGGFTTGGIQVALGDGSVRMGDGSVRTIKTGL